VQILGKKSAERIRMLDGATVEDPFSILSASITIRLQPRGVLGMKREKQKQVAEMSLALNIIRSLL